MNRPTFHWRTRALLVPLAFLGALGGSGSLVSVVKATDSEGPPWTHLHTAWTLRGRGEEGVGGEFRQALPSRAVR